MRKSVALTVLCATLLTVAAVDAAETKKRSVLVIESYHPVLAWTAQCEHGIYGVFKKDDYDVTSVFMDTKRIPADAFAKAADDAWAAYEKAKPDIVLLGDDNALKFLGPRLAKTGTPVVFFGINANPRIYFQDGALPKNITGILERTPVLPWLRTLSSIRPSARRALILMDASETSKAIADVNSTDGETRQLGELHAIWKLTSDWDEWQKIVTETPDIDFILMPTFHAVKRKDGSAVSVDEVIAWTAGHAKVPTFTNQDYTVSSDGVVGAYALYGKTHGKAAAELAKEIVEGTKDPATTPPQTDKLGRYYFSEKGLDRFDISVPKDIEETAIYR